jgi:energy-coupling factor transporter ATP-binding protein EcfA2
MVLKKEEGDQHSFCMEPQDIPHQFFKILVGGATPHGEGPPGCGKSANMLRLAALLAKHEGRKVVVKGNPKKKNEFGYFNVRLGNNDVIDIFLPYIYGEGSNKRQGRAMMDVFPTEGPALLVLDEAGQNQDMQRIIRQVVYERCLNNDWVAPPSLYVVLLSNRAKDRAGSTKFLTNLSGVITTVQIKPTVKGFLEENKETIREEISSLVSWFPNLLDTFDPTKDGAFSSCRSLMLMSGLLNSKPDPVDPADNLDRCIVNGTIGLLAGTTLASICRYGKKLPDPYAFMNEPEAYRGALEEMVTNPAMACALNMALARCVKEDTEYFGPAMNLMDMISEERAVAFMSLILILNKEVKNTVEYGHFNAKYKELMF